MQKGGGYLVGKVTTQDEALIFPTIPTYDKRNITAIRAFETYWSSYGLQTSEEICRAIKNGTWLSSYGVDMLNTISKVIENFSVKDLEEAEAVLSDGLTKLKEYDIRNVALAGQYAMEGSVDLPFLGGITGGKAPMSGTLTETKPSGFNDYKISGKDLEKYMDDLWSTLTASEIPLKEGFKSKNNDENFGKWLKSIVQKEALSLSEIVSTNTYLENIRNDCQTASKTGGIFKKYGLNELYKLPDKEKKEKLKNSGFKIMSSFEEKYLSDFPRPSLYAGIAGILASKIIDEYVPEPYSVIKWPVAALTLLGMFLMMSKSSTYEFTLRSQGKTFEKIENELHK